MNIVKMKKRIGSLDAYELAPSPESSAAPVAGAVVLLHGFGADFNDLVSLAQMVKSPAAIRWYFLNAPHSVALGPHMTGRAWFPLRMAELEEQGFDYENRSPEGMAAATSRVLESLNLIRESNGLNWDQLAIGGFSQGSMIASHVAAAVPESIGGLIIFSGALVDRETLAKEPVRLNSAVRFFQSHGRQDPLLEFAGAERLEATLHSLGAQGVLIEFRGGHEIPATVLSDWSSWLRGLKFWPKGF